MLMRNYFILYKNTKEINYLFLFMLYGIAEYNTKERIYNYISFTSYNDLYRKLQDTYTNKCYSYSTLIRYIQNHIYDDYYIYNNKSIKLKNNFCISSNNNKPFIIISNKDADYLIEMNDTLLASYYCYLKYYCGLASKAKIEQNFTIKQFLVSVGLSPNNHNNYSKISRYNTLLVNDKKIQIKKYRDDLGFERNIYTML